MFSFFCTRQESKGEKYVCLEKGRRGVTILVPDSKQRILTFLKAVGQGACQRPWVVA